MRLESKIQDFYAAGGEPVGISVDQPGRNAAMVRRWHLSFGIESDPGGERLLKPLGLWNEHERGGIGRPAVLVLARDGRVVLEHRSRDFADRPDDSDVVSAVRSLDLPPLEPTPEPWHTSVEPEEHAGAFRTEAFGPYHRGVMFVMAAMAGRMRHDADRVEAEALAQQASSFLEAWKRVRERTQNPEG